jgi:hypothetical protein
MLRELSSAELTEHLIFGKLENEDEAQTARKREEIRLAEEAITGVKKRKSRNGH